MTAEYPSVGQITDLQVRLGYLISEQIIVLPKNVYQRVTTAIENIYRYAHDNNRIERLLERATPAEKEILNVRASDSSVLMAYDFHYSQSDDRLALIEINTNASAYLISELLYRIENDDVTWPNNALDNLAETFHSELNFYKPNCQNVRAAILDQDIPNQKMLTEFYMYLDFFSKMGWAAKLCEVKDFQPLEFDFIYNRFTDFLFSHPVSHKLREEFFASRTCISPHPREYLLLSDKNRLQEFFESKVDPTLVPIFNIKETNAEELWEKRKNLFFKPAQMYGAKATYRGESITRRHFEEILNKDYVAQEFCPAGIWNDWKYDLRFYVYRDKIQLAVARVYKGQVTNFATLGGGLARVHFRD